MVLCGDKLLLYDEACLQVFNQAGELVQMSGQTAECYKCDYQPLIDIPKGQMKNLIISTIHAFDYEASTESYSYCNERYLFRQHGVYGMNITGLACSNIFIINGPDDALKPLWIELLVLLIMTVLCAIGTCAGNSQWFKQIFQSNYVRELENDLGTPLNSENSTPFVQCEFVPSINRLKTRMKSLDAFRGLTIALMIFVNSGGGKYWFFKHAPWNGMTVCDIVFPWFAWIMGASIVMSVRSQLRDRITRWSIFLRCLRRTVCLIALGLILNSLTTNDIYELRIPGVLQRLGLAYFIVATIELLFMEPQNPNRPLGRFMVFQDLICSWIQWMVMLFLAFFHFCLTMYLPLGESCPKGYLGPGGLHEHGKYMNCTGGAAGYIDRMILGTSHLYTHATPSKLYHTSVPYDPEGILGTLNTAFMVFLGAQAGRIILCYSNTSSKIKRWIIWALITGILGAQFCNWQQEGGFIPINKNLWSLSYILITASLAFLLLSVLLLIMDHTKWWSGTPFQQAGKNSILIYVCSEFAKNMLPWSWKPFSDRSSHTEFLIMNTWGTILWLFIAVILDKYEIYAVI